MYNVKAKISIIASAATATGFGLSYFPGYTFLIVFLLVAIVALWLVSNVNLRKVLLVAFLLRLSLMLYQTFIGGLPDSQFDAAGFDYLGQQIAENWLRGEDAGVIKLAGAYPYYYSVGVIYYIFGHIPLIPNFINVMFGVGSVLFIYKITREITESEKVAISSAWIGAIYPTLNLYSALLFRDMAIVFFSLYSFYLFIRWLKNGSLSNICLAVIFLLVGCSLHTAMFPIALVYALFYCFYQPGKKRVYLFGPRLLIGFAGFAAIVLLFGDMIFSKVTPATLLDTDLLGDRLSTYAINRTAYLVDMYPTSLFDAAMFTPVRMIYFYFAPFPWMARTGADLFALFDTSLYAVLILLFFIGLKSIKKESKPLFYAIALVFLFESFVFAWGVSNYGSGVRHRIKVLCFIIPVAMIGWDVLKERLLRRAEEKRRRIKLVTKI